MEEELPKEVAEIAAKNAEALAKALATRNSLRNLHSRGIEAGPNLLGLGWYKTEIETFTREFLNGFPKETFSKKPGEEKEPGLKDAYPASVKKQYNALLMQGKTPEDAVKITMDQERKAAGTIAKELHRFEVNLEYNWLKKYIATQGADTAAEKKRLEELKPEYKKVNDAFLAELEQSPETTREEIKGMERLYEEIGRKMPDLNKFKPAPEKRSDAAEPQDRALAAALDQFNQGYVPGNARMGYNVVDKSPLMTQTPVLA